MTAQRETTKCSLACEYCRVKKAKCGCYFMWIDLNVNANNSLAEQAAAPSHAVIALYNPQ